MFRQPIVDLGAALGRPLRVLIVEDSKDDVVLLLRALRAGGFEPSYQVVETSAAMRDDLELHEWDLITSDHAMPQFSGASALALARILRPDVPFVIVSGEIDLDVAVSLIKGGAEDYVQKSQLPRLPQVIERVLQAAAGRRQQQSSELALQVSEARYRRLFETAQDGILIVDADSGQIEDVNPFLSGLVGYSREEYLDKKLWEIGPFKDNEASKSAFLELQKKGYIRFEDIPLRTSAGGHVDVEFVSNVYMVGTKRVIQCNIRDITERRRAEAEVRMLTADLEERVVRRTAQVEILNKELETFNYSVSHDLQAPLRRIAGFIKALVEDCAVKLDSEGQRLIGDIQRSSDHMTRLIEALLKLSSFSSTELHWTRTNLSSIAHMIAGQLQEADAGRKVEFVIAENIVVAGDPDLLRVIMENLLGNAWKFTSHRESGRIEFGVSPKGGEAAVLFVRDNGAGFDMEYAGKLFGAFQRLHAENEFPGTGIGLASVRRIVHGHGGHIWAESEVGKGTTFYFVLEAVTKHRAASAGAVG